MAIEMGEFSVDPDSIVEAELPPKGIPLTFSIDTAERRVGKEKGTPYITTTLAVVDYPGAKVFQSWFLTPNALAQRSASISWKKFLLTMGLGFETTAQDLPQTRFVGVLKHTGQGDEAKAEIDRITGPAQ